jgi:magnesium-transporting ATPase (P-type)
LRYLLSSNMGEVLTVFLGVLLAGVLGLSGHGEAVVLPLLATQILWINPITDAAPPLAWESARKPKTWPGEHPQVGDSGLPGRGCGP